jgi:hypothetical protein
MIFKFLVLSWMLGGGFYRCDFDKKTIIALTDSPFNLGTERWQQKKQSRNAKKSPQLSNTHHKESKKKKKRKGPVLFYPGRLHHHLPYLPHLA